MSELTLSNSCVHMILITAAYIAVVFKIGPQYMKNRAPYTLHTYLRLYNLFQVVVNSWLVGAIWQTGHFTINSGGCRIIKDLTDPLSTRVMDLLWWTLVLKLIDLSETPVFILRKKQRQISFLHLYHHISTTWICWLTLRYYSCAAGLFYVLINASVHVIMYSYYLLATIKNPIVQSIVHSIKSIITIVQMVQFVILLVYNLLVFVPECQHMWSLAILSETNLIMNFALFYNFYKTTYKKPKIK